MPDTLRSSRHKLLISLLIEARKKAGFNQAQLADQLGRHQSFIANVETNLRRIDVVEFLDLADALKINAGDVLARLQKEKPTHRRRPRSK